MNPSQIFSQELELTNQMLLVLQRFKLWILVAAAAGALAAAVFVKIQPPYAVAKAGFTLAEHKVKQLAAVYDRLPSQTPLMLGALEIDEVARFAALLDNPVVWQRLWGNKDLCQQFASLCAKDNTEQSRQLTAAWRGKFQFEHKRRGNLLTMQWRAADAAQAQALLNALIQSAEAEYKAQAMSQYQARAADLQRALEKAATVGERSEISVQLDKVQAELNILQNGTQTVLHAIQPLSAKTHKTRPLLFVAVVAALLSALLATLLLLLFYRR
jgi:hypothetical protein